MNPEPLTFDSNCKEPTLNPKLYLILNPQPSSNNLRHWAMISNTAQGVRILCEAGATH